jgi:hypothetical protein
MIGRLQSPTPPTYAIDLEAGRPPSEGSTLRDALTAASTRLSQAKATATWFAQGLKRAVSTSLHGQAPLLPTTRAQADAADAIPPEPRAGEV